MAFAKRIGGWIGMSELSKLSITTRFYYCENILEVSHALPSWPICVHECIIYATIIPSTSSFGA